MAGLEVFRDKIDEIDSEIIRLFQERMELVTNVAKYKLENNLPVFQKDREQIVIDKNLKRVEKEDMKEYAKDFIQAMMDISKEYQKEQISSGKKKQINIVENKKILSPIGYGGAEGAFSEEALIKYFGEEKKRKNYPEFQQVFEALKDGEISYGVVPIENSSTGVINDVYDMLRKYGFYIVGEEYLSISQHLLGKKGTEISEIEEVHSHPQGIQQSSEFLKGYGDWKRIPEHNTALAAKMVSESNDNKKVAIASKRAANIYGLEILKENINNEISNKTRFVIIGKELESTEDKISIIFKLEHKVGSLLNILKFVNDYGLNMVKIESRPVGDEPWQYYFYLDFQGDLKDENVKNLLEEIEKKTSYFKLLGAYKSKG